jgi:3-oxoacyl-[acyl-carrier protein] reductase
MALTRTAAAEGAEAGVRVNAVSPSLALHPFLNRVMSDDALDTLRRNELFGRGAETWEVANVIVFLASDYSSYMSGEVVSVSSQHP